MLGLAAGSVWFTSWVETRRTDPVGEVYMGYKPIFPHFERSFLSLHFPFSLFSLFSLLLSLSSPTRESGGRNDSDAVASESSRRRHRVGAKTPSFFEIFLLFLCVLTSRFHF